MRSTIVNSVQRNGLMTSMMENLFRKATMMLGYGCLVSVLMALGTIAATWADQQLPIMMNTAYQDGTITAIYEATFQIDGRTYSFAPDAVIVNDKGVEIEASALVVTAEVKYHVKKEHYDKIDRMILFLPR